MKALAIILALLPAQALAAVPVLVINGTKCQLSSMYLDSRGNRVIVVNYCLVVKKVVKK